jgi:hypothetical protein
MMGSEKDLTYSAKGLRESAKILMRFLSPEIFDLNPVIPFPNKSNTTPNGG